MTPESPQGERIGPWTRLSSRDIYDNPWIHLREDQIVHPDGTPGIYGMVHFKNLAVGVVAIDSRGQVVLVGQYRYPFRSYFWELPEGGCPLDRETPEEGAARELREETGYAAGRWDYLGCFTLSNSVSDELAHLFLARDLTAGCNEPESSEELEVKSVDFEEAWRMAMEGALNESLTIVALARAKHFMEMEKAGTVPVYPRRPGEPR